MTEHDIKSKQISFDYLTGRLSSDQRSAFDSLLMGSTDIQEDIEQSAMLIELMKDYAANCCRTSLQQMDG